MSDLLERMRALEADHEPNGWPAVQMRDISALCDAVECARAQSGQGAEPVAWLVENSFTGSEALYRSEAQAKAHRCVAVEIDAQDIAKTITPLYAHPQSAQQGSVPEGWKLVPVEPTAAMISAFEHAPCAENYTDAATWAWEAMLDAAPQPPQEGLGDE